MKKEKDDILTILTAIRFFFNHLYKESEEKTEFLDFLDDLIASREK